MNIEMSIKSEEVTPMLCPIIYTGTLPDPILGCKITSVAKTLKDFAEEPMSLPDVELQYTQHFKGLQMLLNVDLVSQEAFEDPKIKPSVMEEQDATLLADVTALVIDEVPIAGPSPSGDPKFVQMTDHLERVNAKGAIKPISPLAREPPFTDSFEINRLPKRPKIKRSKEYTESRKHPRDRKK